MRFARLRARTNEVDAHSKQPQVGDAVCGCSRRPAPAYFFDPQRPNFQGRGRHCPRPAAAPGLRHSRTCARAAREDGTRPCRSGYRASKHGSLGLYVPAVPAARERFSSSRFPERRRPQGPRASLPQYRRGDNWPNQYMIRTTTTRSKALGFIRHPEGLERSNDNRILRSRCLRHLPAEKRRDRHVRRPERLAQPRSNRAQLDPRARSDAAGTLEGKEEALLNAVVRGPGWKFCRRSEGEEKSSRRNTGDPGFAAQCQVPIKILLDFNVRPLLESSGTS